LHVIQPTISARIAQMGAALGTSLSYRTLQRAELTARAEPVDRMHKLSDRTLPGIFRPGAVESVALMALPRLLPQAEAHHPERKVELRSGKHEPLHPSTCNSLT
jgi:DNA-binding transcriptional LysR family regulator